MYIYIGKIERDRMDISQLMREFTALQAAWQVPVVSKDQAAEGMRKQLKCRVSTEISYIVLHVLLVLIFGLTWLIPSHHSFLSNTFPTCLRTSQFHPIQFSHCITLPHSTFGGGCRGDSV